MSNAGGLPLLVGPSPVKLIVARSAVYKTNFTVGRLRFGLHEYLMMCVPAHLRLGSRQLDDQGHI